MNELSRRQVLRRGGALVALAWLSFTLFGHRPPGGGERALGATAFATLRAAMEALLPAGCPVDGLAEGVDRFIGQGDPFDLEQLRLALRVLEHTAAPGLLWRPFSRLNLEERRAVLGSWERSRLAIRRQIFQALRRVALFTWYSDPRSWSELGYEGPWVQP